MWWPSFGSKSMPGVAATSVSASMRRAKAMLDTARHWGFASLRSITSAVATAGEPPPTLLDYLPEDWLLVVDESHQTMPQVRGMYEGDRSRKQTLVDYGFRLPSALDNRPLQFDEFDAKAGQRIYVSATPAPWELARAGGVFVEQVI